MKFLLSMFLVCVTSFTMAQSTTVVISQVYGGGGSATGTYNADYVELHNVSNVDQDISDYKLLYGSSTGNLATSATNAFVFPASTVIPAGGYLLVATTAGTGLAPLPVTADLTFTINLSGTNGKVAFGTADMVSNATLAAQPGGSVIDFVGYGSANEFETAACGALSSTTAAFRNNNGCLDTDNNSTNFTNATPNPRNSASPVVICGVTPLPPSFSIASLLAPFGSVCINTTAGPNNFVLNGTNLDATDITVGPLSGYSFSTSAAGPFSNFLSIPHPAGAYNGTIYVLFTPTVALSYAGTIVVSGGGASSVNVSASGFGVDAAVVFANAATGVTPSSATLPGTVFAGCDPVTAYGMEYSTNAAFTPGTGTQLAGTNLSGSSFSVTLTGLPQSTTYYYIGYATTSTGTVYSTTVQTFTTSFTSSGGTGVVISQLYGGGGSATATFNADFVELHNKSLVDQDISGCKLMYGSAAGNLASTATNAYVFPTGTIIPSGGYLLLATTAGTGLANLPVTADLIFTLNMSGTNGKVAFGTSALLSNQTLAAQPAGAVIDFVGYGTANESETAATPALNTTTAAFRNSNGCDDTNNNLADFTLGAPDPRNSASPIVVCSALPLSFIALDVKRNETKVEVSWKTAAESNLAKFLVEHSLNGIQWRSIATIVPSNNAERINTYSHVDAMPANGLNYYRIRAVELDGKSELSIVKTISLTNPISMNVVPNPAHGQFTILLNTVQPNHQVFIYDVSGKLIKQLTSKYHRINVSTSGMNPGIYMVKTISGQHISTSNIVVQ
jgi:hypothetical protein